MKDYKLNLNDYVKIKLNDIGYQRLADLHNAYLFIIPNWEKRNAKYYKNRADKDGYTSFQLWSFIDNFGGVTGLAQPNYYDLDILITVK